MLLLMYMVDNMREASVCVESSLIILMKPFLKIILGGKKRKLYFHTF